MRALSILNILRISGVASFMAVVLIAMVSASQS